ncbi:MAG: hypothetical protein ACE5KT_02405 [Methanosarcinales archaeon]|nr:hypothetical protein [Methanosarcinales archaeon]
MEKLWWYCQSYCSDLCKWLKSLPYYKKVYISKKRWIKLPPCFKPTYLGEMMPPFIRQFRGPYNTHVHELSDKWVLHKDQKDPRKNPILHLLLDAPEYPTAISSGFTAALMAYHIQKSLPNAILKGFIALLFMLSFLKTKKLVKSLF